MEEYSPRSLAIAFRNAVQPDPGRPRTRNILPGFARPEHLTHKHDQNMVISTWDIWGRTYSELFLRPHPWQVGTQRKTAKQSVGDQGYSGACRLKESRFEF